ncbi:MAG: hypothetical protein KKA48_04000, partial [Proteobacteria bacterium]|nr:hypothetical protein [Pseudomonadota bacterium]
EKTEGGRRIADTGKGHADEKNLFHFTPHLCFTGTCGCSGFPGMPEIQMGHSPDPERCPREDARRKRRALYGKTKTGVKADKLFEIPLARSWKPPNHKKMGLDDFFS